jgi:hypothetical protein
MNHPLPKGMPWREKARIMVARGEARDFGEACSMLSKSRKQKQKQKPTTPRAIRLPYKDND